jgi:hypothetical protein
VGERQTEEEKSRMRDDYEKEGNDSGRGYLKKKNVLNIFSTLALPLLWTLLVSNWFQLRSISFLFDFLSFCFGPLQGSYFFLPLLKETKH